MTASQGARAIAAYGGKRSGPRLRALNDVTHVIAGSDKTNGHRGPVRLA
ncbi:MAG TPA: hypothetical protein VFB54_18430 [Burkholderiales bacterium]|nr:hypothetical protein [Burkholderiales bacterium]